MLQQTRQAQHRSRDDGRQGRETDAQTSTDDLTKQAAAHSQLDKLLADREKAHADGQQLDNALNELRREEACSETRLKLLQEYENKAEGVFKGVKDIIGRMDQMSASSAWSPTASRSAPTTNSPSRPPPVPPRRTSSPRPRARP